MKCYRKKGIKILNFLCYVLLLISLGYVDNILSNIRPKYLVSAFERMAFVSRTNSSKNSNKVPVTNTTLFPNKTDVNVYCYSFEF